METRLNFSGRAIRYTEDEIAAVVEAMRNAEPLTQGKYLAEFERKFAQYQGVAPGSCFAVMNGCAALEMSAQLCAFNPGDEVIMPSHTFTASAYPFIKHGATLAWADIDPLTRVVTPETIEAAITPKTKAVVVVHLYGYVADMPAIVELCRQKGLICIEDAAQSIGSEIDGRKAGSFGDMAIFSFHSHKNFTTLGEGGMLYLRDPKLAALAPMLRHNGHCPYPEPREAYWKPAMGNVDLPMLNGKALMPSNYSIGEVECALGIKLLDRIDQINAEKRARAIKLIDSLADFPMLEFHRVPTPRHNYHLLAARLSGGTAMRDKFMRIMSEQKGIKCVVQYIPLNRYDFYRKLGYGQANCPQADAFFDSMVSFPFQHWMSGQDLEYLITSIGETMLQLENSGPPLKERCIVIPAIKKNAVIPDQLVKKLAGVTLIERALNTARACAKGCDIIVLTDSEEIALICERAGVRHCLNPKLRFHSWDIVAEMRSLLTELSLAYNNAIILRASCPLLTWVDLEAAWRKFLASGADCLITVKNVRQRLWKASGNALSNILEDAGSDPVQEYVVETRALVILRLSFLSLPPTAPIKVAPWFLKDRGLEILDYQDWWICERLLERRRVVFVVAGYAAIGMGHVYRALMLAHEITSHQITFVCTRQSELAAENIAGRDYHVIAQGDEPLWQTVLNQRPDLVINDFLNTSADYMRHVAKICPCVNFEDEGEGARLASLVINALYDHCADWPRVRCGPEYFCLRDEFVHAARNPLRPQVGVLLITFGGTDQRNMTQRALNVTAPICLAFGIAIRIVAGPGYAYKAELQKRLEELGNPLITFTAATNVMSRMMEGADLAIASAGRTVYELAHMRVPAIVLATHEREARHGFARPRHGFAFAGLMETVTDNRLRNLFLAMLKQKRRAWYWERQNRLSFAGNKERVVGLMLDQLEKSERI